MNIYDFLKSDIRKLTEQEIQQEYQGVEGMGYITTEGMMGRGQELSIIVDVREEEVTACLITLSADFSVDCEVLPLTYKEMQMVRVKVGD